MMSETSTMQNAQHAPSAEFVAKNSSRVRVYTPSGVLDGSHHHPPGVRLSDSLRNQATGEKYMLLTDVTITHLDGTTAPAEFVLVNSTHASVIVPLEE
jgi:hypothetical protein